MDEVKINLELVKLDENNFELWLSFLKDVLIYHDLWEYCEDAAHDREDFEGDVLAEFSRCRLYVRSSLDVLHAQEAINNNLCTPYAIVSYFKKKYGAKNVVRMHQIKNQLNSLKLKCIGKLSELYDSFTRLARDYERSGGSLNEEEKALMFMDCLPQEFNVTCQIIRGNKNEVLTLQSVYDQLLVEDKQMEGKSYVPSSDVSLLTRTLCFKCQKPGHVVANCRNSYVSPIECFNCHQRGHLARDCRIGYGKGSSPITCQWCGRDGHSARTCIDRVNKKDEEVCQLCDQTGHSAKQCPTEVKNDKSSFYIPDVSFAVFDSKKKISRPPNTEAVVLKQLQAQEGKLKPKDVKVEPSFRSDLFSVSKSCDNGCNAFSTLRIDERKPEESTRKPMTYGKSPTDKLKNPQSVETDEVKLKDLERQTLGCPVLTDQLSRGHRADVPLDDFAVWDCG